MNGFENYLNEKKISYLLNEPLSSHTTFKIGGCASFFVEVNDENELKSVLYGLRSFSVPYFVIGKGSNLLVSDKGFDGAVIKLSGEFETIRYDGEGTFCAGAGASLLSLCKAALDESMSGLEFAFGIPGTVGGAVFMNAGAYGGQMSDVITSVKAVTVDGVIKTYSLSELELSYRHSVFETNGEIVLFADIQLNEGDASIIRARMNELLSKRKNKQPLEYPSAGSTFKRPEGYFAGALIEQSGLKGFSAGDAQVSEKHAGFVINRGNASFDDVMEVIDHCRRCVKEKFGVDLQPEVKII